tara:strand:+ start:1687 stop:3666 length:1980 start_codon:yes stop_codon:yes gene_type:complete
MPINKETQAAKLQKILEQLQANQTTDAKNTDHIADTLKTDTGEKLLDISSVLQTGFGTQQKENKKNQGDNAEKERENRNLFGKIADGISGVKQATVSASSKAAKGAGGLLASMGKTLKGGLMGGGALLAGAGLLAGGAGMLINSLNEMDADEIKEKVKTLISIKDDVGGAGDFFVGGGAFLLAMTGIGLGLAVFSVGSTVAGMSQGLLDYFGQGNWAEGIKQNVITLMSISDELGGALAFIGDSAAFLLAMTGIAAGLAVFGAGSAVGGISTAMDVFTSGQFAEGIKQNVLTLLSIKDSLGGNVDLLTTSGVFLAAMTGIGTGLAVFGVGSGIAGLAGATELFQSGEFAENIKTNVLTLLSIKDSLGGNLDMLADGGAFGLAMTGIGLGLAAFGIGSILNSFQSPEFGAKIKENVLQLLSIPDSIDGNIEEKASQVNVAMGHLSEGLGKFAGGTFVSSLANAATGILNFFTGGESPIDEMLKLAEKDQEIASTERNISRMVVALERFSSLNLTGPSIDFTQLLGSVGQAIPFIQALGGTHPEQLAGKSVNVGGGFFGGGVDFGPHGILDEGLKIEEISGKIQQITGALGISPTLAVAGGNGAGMQISEQQLETAEMQSSGNTVNIVDNSSTDNSSNSSSGIAISGDSQGATDNNLKPED